MITPEMNNSINQSNANIGQLYKEQSDMIYEYTWGSDIQSKQCYIYDYFHDDTKSQYKGYDPSLSETKYPIDAKFIITQYNTLSKDQVEYHISFKPSVQELFETQCPLAYFKKDYLDEYWVEFPMGLYIDIPDDNNIYHKWLIVGTEVANQFRKYSVLPCNYYFTWVMSGQIYEMYGVARLRNSYNSGVWADYSTTSVENQDQIWFPLNSITANITYSDDAIKLNQRIIVSAPIPQPNAWYVSKLENLHPIGVNKITLSQTKFNQDLDILYVAKDGRKHWLADYKSVQPDANNGFVNDKTGDEATISVKYDGQATLKIGESKQFSVVCSDTTATFTDLSWVIVNNETISSDMFTTSFIPDSNYTQILLSVNDNVDPLDILGETFELKVTNSDSTLTYTQSIRIEAL